MVLQVEIERFATEARKRISVSEVYVSARAGGTLVSAFDPEKQLLIQAVSRKPEGEVWRIVQDAGFTVSKGAWAAEGIDLDLSASGEVYVAAVSYKSVDPKPGLWVDTYPAQPTPAEVLMNLYEEFKETGEIAEVSFEEFMSLANPNVVILSPDEIRFHRDQKVR